MATRTGFRPRPLDTTRQLNIVRDIKELDDGEQKVSRDIVHSHEALDKDNEEVKHCTVGVALAAESRPRCCDTHLVLIAKLFASTLMMVSAALFRRLLPRTAVMHHWHGFVTAPSTCT